MKDILGTYIICWEMLGTYFGRFENPVEWIMTRKENQK